MAEVTTQCFARGTVDVRLGPFKFGVKRRRLRRDVVVLTNVDGTKVDLVPGADVFLESAIDFGRKVSL